MTEKRLLVVVGARPNYMKAAPLLESVRSRDSFQAALVHTGQHFDPELSALLMNELGMREPDHKLAAGKTTPLNQIATILAELERVCVAQRPDAIVVVGDVNSTLAGALVANKLGITLAHVEAGLRSHDPEMPEEWNRRATDLFADLLFCTERSGVEALLREGKREEQIFLVGNGMIDTLLRLRPAAEKIGAAGKLGLLGPYGLVTLHRPSNVDDPETLRALLEGTLLPLAEQLPLVFPVHPRTKTNLERALAGRPAPRLVRTPPLGYLDFVSLMIGARLVITDSGGIQEETTVLGVPCLTVRENTERPITIEMGTNRLVGTNPAAVLAASRELLGQPPKAPRRPPLWDGRAGERTIEILAAHLSGGFSAATVAARRVGARVGREGL
jgi:UDP-N-acetylglucosamine 2-epimerase (non-hydrolysing)